MKTAVVLFNLGGPDRLDAVQPFLFNLFNDPAIIGLPRPFRSLLARFLSQRRDKKAQAIYAKIGGYSPILRNTQLQAAALQDVLNNRGDGDYKCFVAMRYWHPFVDETILDVKDFSPDAICLLPLYPQFSTTTTGSSLASWHVAAKAARLNISTRAICCYFDEPGFIQSVANLVRDVYPRAAAHGRPRVLFSAHGLPEKIIRDGDPYRWQCEQTVQAIVHGLSIENLDWSLCYQSRVGPLKWIGPSTDDEVRRAGSDRVPLVIVPIAFVSEHSETLVEIDIDYRHMAQEAGVPFFVYSGTVNRAVPFIDGLSRLISLVQKEKPDCVFTPGGRHCPPASTGCLCKTSKIGDVDGVRLD